VLGIGGLFFRSRDPMDAGYFGHGATICLNPCTELPEAARKLHPSVSVMSALHASGRFG
jgi:hypothetical protein